MYNLSQLNWPLVRAKPWYPGQAGIAHSDNALGLRTIPQALPIYVDPAIGDDDNDGTDPEGPKATIQSAANSPFLENGSIIALAPGAYTESVITPNWVIGPNYVTIIGLGATPYAVQWQSDAINLPCLDVRAVGWRVENVRMMAPTQEACIQLRHTDTGADDIAIQTVLQNILFDGLTTGRYGVVSHGAYDVWIKQCVFQLFHNGVGGGAVPLLTGTTPLAIPYRNHILDCMFWDSDNGAIFPCNGSEIKGNVFQPTGYAYAMTQVLNTSIVANPGDDNVVTRNVMPGDYSIAGGYRPGAADFWGGNFAEDLAEPEVSDSGITIARPI